MIHTIFRKHIALTLILTLMFWTTLMGLRSAACPIQGQTYADGTGWYSQHCDNTEKSVSVSASVSKGMTWKYWIIPSLYVSSSASFSSITVANNSGDYYLDAYVEGFASERYKSGDFEGSDSDNHYHYNDWAFGSPSQNPRNEANAEVEHDNHSDVSTDFLSI